MASKPGLGLLRRGVGGRGPHEVVRPAQEVVVGVGVEPEQIGDDHEGEERRHVPHEVALAHSHRRGRGSGRHRATTVCSISAMRRGVKPTVHQARGAGGARDRPSRSSSAGACHAAEAPDGSRRWPDPSPRRARRRTWRSPRRRRPRRSRRAPRRRIQRPDLVRVVRVPGAVEEVEPGPRGLGRRPRLMGGVGRNGAGR